MLGITEGNCALVHSSKPSPTVSFFPSHKSPVFLLDQVLQIVGFQGALAEHWIVEVKFLSSFEAKVDCGWVSVGGRRCKSLEACMVKVGDPGGVAFLVRAERWKARRSKGGLLVHMAGADW
jgi:hypothetical protein